MLTSQERPVAQGRVCAGDMPTWPQFCLYEIGVGLPSGG